MEELKRCPCCNRTYGINTEQEVIKTDFNTRPAISRDKVVLSEKCQSDIDGECHLPIGSCKQCNLYRTPIYGAIDSIIQHSESTKKIPEKEQTHDNSMRITISLNKLTSALSSINTTHPATSEIVEAVMKGIRATVYANEKGWLDDDAMKEIANNVTNAINKIPNP
jgi:hypothetical protein